jgi:hypothetical protein
MTNSIFSSFFQLAGAKSFSDFLKEDDQKENKRRKKRSLKKTVAQRRKTRLKTSRKTTRRSARRTARRSVRRTARRSVRRTARRSVRRTARRSVRRTARRSAKRSNRRTARRSTRRTSRKSNRIVKVRNLTNRKHKGPPGKHECITCKKGVKAYFTGKEPSPKGLGYCARCTPLNVTMKGKDGNLWENKKYSKGKRWVRV